MEIKTSRDYVNFIVETMEGVKEGDVSAPAGNAIANLGAKILQMITLEMKAMNFPKLAERTTLRIEADTKKGR